MTNTTNRTGFAPGHWELHILHEHHTTESQRQSLCLAWKIKRTNQSLKDNNYSILQHFIPTLCQSLLPTSAACSSGVLKPEEKMWRSPSSIPSLKSCFRRGVNGSFLTEVQWAHQWRLAPPSTPTPPTSHPTLPVSEFQAIAFAQPKTDAKGPA